MINKYIVQHEQATVSGQSYWLSHNTQYRVYRCDEADKTNKLYQCTQEFLSVR